MRTLESPAAVSFLFVVGWWEVFGVVVGSVVQLGLGDAVLEPVVAHVEGFGPFHLHLCFGDVVGCGIVGFKGSFSGQLLVAHFFNSGDDGNGLLAVEKEAASLGFSCGDRDPRRVLQRQPHGCECLEEQDRPHQQ